MRKNRIKSVVCCIFSMGFCFLLSALPVNAEEIAGYHEKVVSEEEAIDDWYAVGRGTYLSYGSAKIQRAGAKKVTISGSTVAHSICEDLRLTLYLDESTNNSNYGTIGTYYFKTTNAGLVSGAEEEILVKSGYYYRARGVHSVFQGDAYESTDTCTDAITAS